MLRLRQLTFHHLFIAFLVILGSSWIWTTVELHRLREEDNAFYSAKVLPSLDAVTRSSDEFQKALRERKAGKPTPLPPIERIDMSALKESLDRTRIRFGYENVQAKTGLGFIGALMAWTIAVQIQVAIRRRKRNAPGRPAVPTAGHLVGELVRNGTIFEARAPGGMSSKAVEIDGRRAIVAFHRFEFVSRFVGNATRELTEVAFPDVLVCSLLYSKAGPYLVLRTTLGKVVITDKLAPFPELVDLLMDIVEVNRSSPSEYRAALAREPVIRTPWYGWAVIACALGSVGALVWWLL